MDPVLLLACLTMSLAGCAMGAFSGMVPGIHVNTLAAILLASYPALEAALPFDPSVSSMAAACCVMSASVVHSYVDFVPSAFMGCPDAEDAVSLLPAHRLLLKGRGMEAVRAAAVGSLVGCSAALLLAVPLQAVLAGGAGGLLSDLAPLVLTAASLILVTDEMRRGSGLWGPFLFVLSGMLGLGCMVLPIPAEGVLGDGSVMMPLLTGLFGVPMMLSASGGGRIPPQRDLAEDPVGIVPGLKGVLMGTVAGWFPGITSTVGASMSSALFPERRPARFISMTASIGSVTSVLSLVTLSVSGSGRSGTALVIGGMVGGSLTGSASQGFMLLLLAAAVGSVMGYAISIRCGKLMSRMIGRTDQDSLNRTVLVLLLALTLVLTGPAGMVVLIASAAVGMVPSEVGAGRLVLCGCLILPVLLFETGVVRSVQLGVRLGQEPRIVDDEPLVGAGADLPRIVPHDDLEHQPPAVDLHELGLAHGGQADRGGGRVGDVQMRADGAGPLVEEGGHAGAGRRLHQGDHGGGREDPQRAAAQCGGGVLLGDGDGPRPLDTCCEHGWRHRRTG